MRSSLIAEFSKREKHTSEKDVNVRIKHGEARKNT